MRPDSSDLALRAEEACFAGWPALREVTMDGWLLRFAGGHTRRANSINVVGPSSGDQARKIAACEAIYRAEGLPTTFRLSTARPEAGLGAALDAAGYGPPRDASLVLHASLAPSRMARDTGQDPVGSLPQLCLGRPDPRWLAASAALAGLDASAAALRARMVEALAVPAAFASVAVDGTVAAQAFGALHRGLVCLNAVATAPEHRGRGLATRAVAAVLGWAERQGAEGACLPVAAGNVAARALYRRCGFTDELSRYHYRERTEAREPV